MKIASRVGMSKIIAVGVGLFVVILGITACYTGKAIGVYRRGSGPIRHPHETIKLIKAARDSAFSYRETLKGRNGSKRRTLEDIQYDYQQILYSDYPNDWTDYDDTEIPEDIPGNGAEGRMTEEEANERLRNINISDSLPVGSREAVYTDMNLLAGVLKKDNPILGHFYFVSVWTAIVLAVFFSSILNLSLTLGDPQPSGKYYKFLDYASNLCSFIFLLFVGIGLVVLVSAAVNRKRDHVKNYVVRQTNASDSDANLRAWKLYLADAYVDPEDVGKTYAQISKNKRKTPSQISREMFDKYENEIMRLYKDQMNFELQITAAVATILYSAVFIVTFVMLCLEKPPPPMQSNLPMMQPPDGNAYYYGPYGAYYGSKQYQQTPGGSMIGGSTMGAIEESSQDGEGSDEDNPEDSEEPFVPPKASQKN